MKTSNTQIETPASAPAKNYLNDKPYPEYMHDDRTLSNAHAAISGALTIERMLRLDEMQGQVHRNADHHGEEIPPLSPGNREGLLLALTTCLNEVRWYIDRRVDA